VIRFNSALKNISRRENSPTLSYYNAEKTNNLDMFSRAAPVVVEGIKNAVTLFGDSTRQRNPAYAQGNWGCNFRDAGSLGCLSCGPQKGE
jgi:hypothetical protein